MFGFKSCKNCGENIPKTFEEFVLKRENDRINLHIRYICFITTSIIVWLIATGTANNKEFTNWISFASTITSIILSVLAIIMSITGENKSESARERLQETSKKIDEVVVSMQSINKKTEGNISEVQQTLEILKNKIDDMDNHLQEFTKEQDNKVTLRNNFENNSKWRKKDE